MHPDRFLLLGALAAIAVSTGCDRTPKVPASPQPPSQKAGPLDPAKMGAPLPPNHPPIGGLAQPGGAPPASGQPAPAAATLIQGRVLETMDSGGYTYVSVQTPSEAIWAAIPMTPVKKGDQVSIVHQMTMVDFESKTLKRKFPRLVFGTLAK